MAVESSSFIPIPCRKTSEVVSPDSEPSQAQGFPSQSSADDGFSAAFGADAESLGAFNAGFADGFGAPFAATAFGDLGAFGEPSDGPETSHDGRSPKKKEKKDKKGTEHGGLSPKSNDFFQDNG